MGKASSGKSTSRNPLESLMATSIYVGNLPWSAPQKDAQALFQPFGEVLSVKLVTNRDTGRALRINKAEPKKPAARRW